MTIFLISTPAYSNNPQGKTLVQNFIVGKVKYSNYPTEKYIPSVDGCKVQVAPIASSSSMES